MKKQIRITLDTAKIMLRILEEDLHEKRDQLEGIDEWVKRYKQSEYLRSEILQIQNSTL